MTYVGVRVIMVSSHIFSDDDLKQLKFLWMPSIVAGGFLYFLNCVLLAANLFNAVTSSPILRLLEAIDLIVCLVIAFGMYRFAKYIETYEKKKQEAEKNGKRLEEIARRNYWQFSPRPEFHSNLTTPGPTSPEELEAPKDVNLKFMSMSLEFS